MPAFTQGRGRETRILSIRGALCGDGRRIQASDLTEQTTEGNTQMAPDGSVLSRHGGGDFVLMAAFVRALEAGDPGVIYSGSDGLPELHLMVFCAGAAWLSDQVECLNVSGID